MVMRLSDRIYVLDDGVKIAEGPPATVRNDPAVIEAYLGHNDIGQTQLESRAAETREGRAWA
jgi:branched-chain amino acid transport system ATP-binding protein